MLHWKACYAGFNITLPTAVLTTNLDVWTGSQPHIAVLSQPSIHIHIMVLLWRYHNVLLDLPIILLCILLFFLNLQPPWLVILEGLPKMLRPIMLLLKPLIQFFMLLWFLCVKIPSPDVFIVQVSPHVSLQSILGILFNGKVGLTSSTYHDFCNVTFELLISALCTLIWNFSCDETKTQWCRWGQPVCSRF